MNGLVNMGNLKKRKSKPDDQEKADKEVQVDDFPTGIRAEPESIKVRLFWRVQK